MIEVTIYSVVTGYIEDVFQVSDVATADLNCQPDQRWRPGAYPPSGFYFDGNDIAPRPVSPPISDGIAPLTIPLPSGAVMMATNSAGVSVSTDDPADPIVLTEPGSYRVDAVPEWPTLPLSQTVEVT